MVEATMRIVFKLFAGLGTHLPPEARRAGRTELKVAKDTTVLGVIPEIELGDIP